jgi:hypothetical protein
MQAISLEPMFYAYMELLETEWLDQIISSSEIKGMPEYINISLSTHDNNRNLQISRSYILNHPIPPEVSRIWSETEIREDHIIARYICHLSRELEG